MPDDEWVELRVHGVSGTPAGSMLDRPYVSQVGGDDESRYFRSVDTAGNELAGHHGQVLEAYHWGRLTSGSKLKALWLILLPFGMVNGAHFMLPASGPGRTARALHATCDALLRLVGVLLTSMFAFAAGLVLIDLIAWRWAPQARFIGSLEPSVVLGAAVLLSAAVVVVLAFLGRGYREGRIIQLRQRIRAWRTHTPLPPTPSVEPPKERAVTPLAQESFYSGDSRTPTLRDLHIAAGLFVVAAMGVWVAHPFAWEREMTSLQLAIAGWVLVVVVVTLLGDPERGTRDRMTEGPAWQGLWKAATSVLGIVGLVGSVAVLVAAVADMGGVNRVEWTALRERPERFDVIANWLLVLGVAALLALFVVNLALVVVRRTDRPQKGSPERYFAPYAWGMAAALFTAIGAFIGVGFSAAVATGVSSALDLSTPVTGSSNGAQVTVGTTPMLDRVAYAWGLNVVILVVIMLVVVAWRMRRRRRTDERVTAMYTADGSLLVPPRWVSRVRFAVQKARVKNAIGPICLAFASAGMILAVALAVELVPCMNSRDPSTCGHLPGRLDLLSQPKYVVGVDGVAKSNLVALFGAWLLIAAAGWLLLQSRKAVAEEGKRRGLNVVWDVLAFWPHAVHPFSPRAYSKRCVEDLRERIRWHLDRLPEGGTRRDLVLCGHSQGSLISFATMMLLDESERDRVALVTFGSQLRVIFPKAFPAYVNFAAITRLYDDLDGAWINLYRTTDQLAGPVLSWNHQIDTDGARSEHFPKPRDGARADEYADPYRTRRCGADWRFADPVAYDPKLQDGAVAEIYGHSWFARNPDWHECMATVRAVPPPDRGAKLSQAEEEAWELARSAGARTRPDDPLTE
ncbi:hypothetical protein FE697_008230 [Mumia zhuanghuii]|uniref:Integral membrane protein n=2 Tax=Mumia TaxID=1546255 RepID=A0ABW1QLZ5_9ACTN|nr:MULTISPECIES: hypothetical protein [Mumia]KAA1423575.1 hypothetical protein FE697_008230 [Mumia zhuanghuii]